MHEDTSPASSPTAICAATWGPDLMTATVDEVMTKNPKTIDRDVLAGEALEILNSSKITTLIVTDAGKPVGIVHLHDFLRAGVA